MSDVWNKAVLYHFFHAIALFILALVTVGHRGAWWLLFSGIHFEFWPPLTSRVSSELTETGSGPDSSSHSRPRRIPL